MSRRTPHSLQCVIAKPVRTLAVGSEPSAASGRRSEVSEWPRSKFQVSAVRQRRNFGHRNRDIRDPRPLGPLALRGLARRSRDWGIRRLYKDSLNNFIISHGLRKTRRSIYENFIYKGREIL